MGVERERNGGETGTERKKNGNGSSVERAIHGKFFFVCTRSGMHVCVEI